MAREGHITKAVYKADATTFIVICESEEAVANWKKDSSIPLTQVVDSFQVFVGQGAQGILNHASKGQLENEFGTSDEDEIVKKIVSHGKIETAKASAHTFGSGNDSRGSGGKH